MRLPKTDMMFQVFLALILLGCLAWPGGVFAQNEGDEDKAEKPKAGIPIGRTIRIDENTMNQWILGNKNALTARQHLQINLVRRIDEIHQLCRIDHDQRAKLRLAGDVEIKRLFDKVDECRRKWSGTETQNVPNELLLDVEFAREAVTRVRFRERCFFDKVVRTTLLPEQLSEYEAQLESFRRRRHEVQRKLLLRTLGRNSPLTGKQRKQLTELLQSVPAVPDGSEQLYAFVIIASSRIPKEEFHAILDDSQWHVMEVLYKNSAIQEPALKRRGALETDEDLEP